MPKTVWSVTAYEVVPITRRYVASTQQEAVEKMARFTAKREDEGRSFLSGFKAAPSET